MSFMVTKAITTGTYHGLGGRSAVIYQSLYDAEPIELQIVARPPPSSSSVSCRQRFPPKNVFCDFYVLSFPTQPSCIPSPIH
jgi:hypothetical protein